MRLLHRWGLPGLVATLCFAVFIPSLDGQFLNWDDQVNFVSNPDYRGLGMQQIRWMLTSTLMGHWIPLTWLSFGVNYEADSRLRLTDPSINPRYVVTHEAVIPKVGSEG